MGRLIHPNPGKSEFSFLALKKAAPEYTSLACSRCCKGFSLAALLMECRPHRHSSRCSKFPRQKRYPGSFRRAVFTPILDGWSATRKPSQNENSRAKMVMVVLPQGPRSRRAEGPALHRQMQCGQQTAWAEDRSRVGLVRGDAVTQILRPGAAGLRMTGRGGGGAASGRERPAKRRSGIGG